MLPAAIFAFVGAHVFLFRKAGAAGPPAHATHRAHDSFYPRQVLMDIAFTAVLMLRPQDTLPILNPLHLAELCAIIGIAPMILHRFARRLPVFRVTPETIGLMTLGAVMLATVPFSIWPANIGIIKRWRCC